MAEIEKERMDWFVFVVVWFSLWTVAAAWLGFFGMIVLAIRELVRGM